MNRLVACFVCIFALISSVCVAQGSKGLAPTRANFVSEASFLFGTYPYKSKTQSVDAMVKATNEFLASLTDDQRKLANHKLNSPERKLWTNLPAPTDAGGIRLGDLNEAQLRKSCVLLASLLSEQGFEKMRDIMLADDQLLRNGKPRAGFGTENFSIVIFGTPSNTAPWAFQLDGHHVGFNLAIEGEKMTMSPSFIGTQPQMFRIGRRRYRPFANETDVAHELMSSLSDAQIKAAVLGPKRDRIRTGPGRDGVVPQANGVDCSTFSKTQKELLLKLIGQWVNDLPEPQAVKRMAQISQELDEMKLSWNGNKEQGSDISYRIQSPSLIIEYACQDLGGDPLDHLHSIYRDPTNEYGKQLDNE